MAQAGAGWVRGLVGATEGRKEIAEPGVGHPLTASGFDQNFGSLMLLPTSL
jgi:hypothetical protein